jgi:hypothetical protein
MDLPVLWIASCHLSTTSEKDALSKEIMSGGRQHGFGAAAEQKEFDPPNSDRRAYVEMID